MLICHRLAELPALGVPLHLALGVFDGVHLGHQEVIARAVSAARRDGGLAGMLTFDPHPIRVIAPQKAPVSSLATLDQKARIVEGLGIGLFISLHFDAELARMEAHDFLDELLRAPVKTIAVGEDWRFGKGRAGDLSLLRQARDPHGFALEAVAPVMLDGDRISSTRVRQAIRDGSLKAARRMLGRPYTIQGKVIEGRKLGRTLGFPTANVAPGELQTPPDGVWAVRMEIAGEWLPGVANLGWRPTVEGEGQLLEVHLFDFSGDLYGREIQVEFIEFIRPEEKFGSLEKLQAQIRRDAVRARESVRREAQA